MCPSCACRALLNLLLPSALTKLALSSLAPELGQYVMASGESVQVGCLPRSSSVCVGSRHVCPILVHSQLHMLTAFMFTALYWHAAQRGGSCDWPGAEHLCR